MPLMKNSSSKENYLESFNKVVFIDDNTIVIEQRYTIKRIEHFSTMVYSISNINNFWKESVSFSTSFDHADLESVVDRPNYKVRILKFTLWRQDLLCGHLSIKLGYENDHHEISEKIAEFFQTKIIPGEIKIEN